MYPKLKGSLPENLKHLKNTMDGVNWKVSSGPAPGALPPDAQSSPGELG